MPSSRSPLALLLPLAAAALAACPPPGPRPDGGRLPDGGFDPDAPRGTTPLFGACGHERECLEATGVTCLTTFPRGLCTRRCDSDAECGARGTCRFHVCLPACTTGFQCAEIGGACERAAMPGDLGVCTPSCSAFGGLGACAAGLTCDEYTGACLSEPPPAGADNGGACRESDECRSGQCVGEVRSDGSASGFVGGYCISNGTMPPAEAFRSGAPLPRSSCPAGSAVLPTGGSEGDRVPCLRACTGDGECRAGYYCERFAGALGVQPSTGLCWPVNCVEPGRSCPSGYRCEVRAGTTTGVCARAS